MRRLIHTLCLFLMLSHLEDEISHFQDLSPNIKLCIHLSPSQFFPSTDKVFRVLTRNTQNGNYNFGFEHEQPRSLPNKPPGRWRATRCTNNKRKQSKIFKPIDISNKIPSSGFRQSRLLMKSMQLQTTRSSPALTNALVICPVSFSRWLSRWLAEELLQKSSRVLCGKVSSMFPKRLPTYSKLILNKRGGFVLSQTALLSPWSNYWQLLAIEDDFCWKVSQDNIESHNSDLGDLFAEIFEK